MTNEFPLVALEPVKAAQLFAPGGVDQALAFLRSAAEAAVEGADVRTKEGKALIRTAAANIRKSKTVLEDAGKEIVAEWKAKSAAIDAGRRALKEGCDALWEEIRKPLTAIEEEEARIAAEEESARQAEFAAAAAAQAAELEALRIKAAALERAERDRQIAEAAREAEQKRQADAVKLAELRAQQAERDRLAAEKRAEEDARLAAYRAEQQAAQMKYAAEQAETRAQAAAEQARIDQEQAVLLERARAEQQALRLQQEADEKERKVKAEADRLAANKAHRKMVIGKIQGWIENYLEQGGDLKAMIESMAAGQCPNVIVTFNATAPVKETVKHEW